MVDKQSTFTERESLVPKAPIVITLSDAATSEGWGTSTKYLSTVATWTKEERKVHINIQELMAVKLAAKTFTKNKSVLYPLADRQHSGPILSYENVGNQKFRIPRYPRGFGIVYLTRGLHLLQSGSQSK